MIDPRGPRTVAAVTTVVLAVVLLTGSWPLLALQAVVFALGARDRSPYAVLFRRVVRPRLNRRLGPPAELEDPRPVRFAQVVGLVFAVVGALAGAVGLTPLFYVATAFALAAAFLNAAFGFCLGCVLYLSISKIRREGATA